MSSNIATVPDDDIRQEFELRKAAESSRSKAEILSDIKGERMNSRLMRRNLKTPCQDSEQLPGNKSLQGRTKVIKRFHKKYTFH